MRLLRDKKGIELHGFLKSPLYLPAPWLRALSVEAGLYVRQSRAWTDGANFHPQSVTFAVDIEIVAATLDGSRLEFEWADGTRNGVGLDLLQQRLRDEPLTQLTRTRWTCPRVWMTVDYAELSQDDDVLFDVLRSLATDGVVMVRNLPADDLSAAALANRIGRLETSHLGDTFRIHYRSDSTHIGEEMGEIPLHIDLVYRQHPPDFQILHALTQIGVGGENVFVDVEHIAALLTESEKQLLSAVCLDFVASSFVVYFRGRHSMLTIDPDGLLRVAYNQYKVHFPHDTPDDYYATYDRFQQLINDPTNQVEFVLPEDHAVVFDNRRVLHGRRSFDDPSRDVIGCFVSGDDVRSRLRQLLVASVELP